MKLEDYLWIHFGFPTFKEGQKEVIQQLLLEKNVLAVLPTGTGKSLCYQYIGMMREGIVIIVSPLLSLMEDQVHQLQQKNIGKPVAINSSLTYFEKEYVLDHLSEYKFVFLSPEMLFQEKVRKRLSSFEIGLFVVDEAHCISHWGIDFRPEYSKLSIVQKELGYPLTLALTATATPEVRKEIEAVLFPASHSFREVIYSVNRQNIGLIVDKTTNKEEQLLGYLKKLTTKGIIYCSTRKSAEKISELLLSETNLRTTFYHGGMTPMERTLIQQQFILNQLDVLCATNAFGMGIDKSDIRFIIHYDCPDSLANYVQEIGRAGRDGRKSLAILLYKKGDEQIHRFFQAENQFDRQLLKTMFTLDPIRLNEMIPNMNEIQQKWLQGYLDQEYSFEELEERLRGKEKDRKRLLNEMMCYIHKSDCRRKYIQKAFSETILDNDGDSFCCDCCGLVFENNQIQLMDVQESSSEVICWRETLLRLFKDTK